MSHPKSLAKPIIVQTRCGVSVDLDQTERQVALEYIAEAWNTAKDDGIETRALAQASLFAALATLVSEHGEERAAEMIAELPEKLRAGDYTLDRTIQ